MDSDMTQAFLEWAAEYGYDTHQHGLAFDAFTAGWMACNSGLTEGV